MTAPAPDLAAKVARPREGDRVRAMFRSSFGSYTIEGLAYSLGVGMLSVGDSAVRLNTGDPHPHLLDVDVLEPAPLHFKDGDIATWLHRAVAIRRDGEWWSCGASRPDEWIARRDDLRVIRRDPSEPGVWREVSP